jgi:hypothetical protein
MMALPSSMCRLNFGMQSAPALLARVNPPAYRGRSNRRLRPCAGRPRAGGSCNTTDVDFDRISFDLVVGRKERLLDLLLGYYRRWPSHQHLEHGPLLTVSSKPAQNIDQ